ncbi:MAG: tRNA (adenosine(37)-N6)-threonylcarbamoyltransferase complex dimerization subunit type 1 TsaB [Bacteroidia bacterium]|nr:tRNA (adenosine(37)-N6)-threonylcarbamoyltransferase complex dimerization subunit type 1 TsaB [Bacteroidia bacterium]
MALILNIETATTVCSVSIAKDGKLIAFKEQGGEYSHAENLTVFIQDVLQQANVQLIELNAIAVSKGPGSYTGLRIGVSAAKGLCYALEIPLIAINTLEHLSLLVSENEKKDVLYCPMIDARRMEVYCSVFKKNGECILPTCAKIIDENSFEDILKINTLFYFGDGAEKCKAVLSNNKNAIFIKDIFTSAKSMVKLSEQAYANKLFEDVAYFEPFYLKDFVAGKKKEDN